MPHINCQPETNPFPCLWTTAPTIACVFPHFVGVSVNSPASVPQLVVPPIDEVLDWCCRTSDVRLTQIPFKRVGLPYALEPLAPISYKMLLVGQSPRTLVLPLLPEVLVSVSLLVIVYAFAVGALANISGKTASPTPPSTKTRRSNEVRRRMRMREMKVRTDVMAWKMHP